MERTHSQIEWRRAWAAGAAGARAPCASHSSPLPQPRAARGPEHRGRARRQGTSSLNKHKEVGRANDSAGRAKKGTGSACGHPAQFLYCETRAVRPGRAFAVFVRTGIRPSIRHVAGARHDHEGFGLISPAGRVAPLSAEGNGPAAAWKSSSPSGIGNRLPKVPKDSRPPETLFRLSDASHGLHAGFDAIVVEHMCVPVIEAMHIHCMARYLKPETMEAMFSRLEVRSVLGELSSDCCPRQHDALS
jgi:hypothetical protein